jgi:hypothetical protein
LVKTLDAYRVSRATAAHPHVISAWQSLITRGRAPTEARSESLISNALPIKQLPDRVGLYRLARPPATREASAIPGLALPHAAVGCFIVGFCSGRDYAAAGSLSFDIQHEVPFVGFEQEGFAGAGIDAVDARRHLVSLLRQHWDTYCAGVALRSFEFAGHSIAWWPSLAEVGETMLPFPSPLGGIGRRQVVGSSYQLKWHYGVTAIPRLGTNACFTLVNRVIFTEDGETPIADAKRMHRLRRSRCKSWRNDRWRDLLLAFTHWLAVGSDTIELPCGSRPPIKVSAHPRMYSSGIRLLAPDAEGEPEFPIDESEDDDDSLD